LCTNTSPRKLSGPPAPVGHEKDARNDTRDAEHSLAVNRDGTPLEGKL
jgi:hypothetical protein